MIILARKHLALYRRTATSGDCGKARQLLTEAIDLYGEIGMPKYLAMAEEVLAGRRSTYLD